jgi:hypothetical protein
MSLAGLANDELLRRDRFKLDLTRIVDPELQRLNLNADQVDVGKVRAALTSAAAENPIQQNSGSSALDGLVKYVPTESVTLYVAATSAISSLTAALPAVTPARLYGFFIFLTPILFLLIYIGKRRSQNLSFMPGLKKWPWWKLIASTIAFSIWALAVPPFVSSDAGKVAAGFGALLVSTFLGLFGNVFEPSASGQAGDPPGGG